MRAVRIHETGDYDKLVYEDAPEPTLATGDVLVKVHAASFVPDELSWPSTWVDRAGRDRTPTIPAREVAGEVAKVGYGTPGFSVGDRVVGLADWHRNGAAAEYIAVEGRNLAALPPSVDDLAAAALPLAGLTAWQGLFVHGQLRAGQTVAVHGAGGGVGAFAVQLALEVGARVVGTGLSVDEGLARDLGAEVFVDVDKQPLEDAINQVDLVFDTVGRDLLARSAAVVRPGGTIVSIAAPPPAPPEGGHAVYFIVEPDRTQLAELVRRVETGSLRPQVGATYPLSETKEAFAAKRTGRARGKVVLKVS